MAQHISLMTMDTNERNVLHQNYLHAAEPNKSSWHADFERCRMIGISKKLLNINNWNSMKSNVCSLILCI